MKRTKTIAYWVTTTLIAAVLVSGGFAGLAHRRETAEGMLRLGYPAYFTTILGCWKLFGAIALLAPSLPRLKEWAYAGVAVELIADPASIRELDLVILASPV